MSKVVDKICVTLEDRACRWVASFPIPHYRPPPDVIVRHGRSYVRVADRAGVYREAFIYVESPAPPLIPET